MSECSWESLPCASTCGLDQGLDELRFDRGQDQSDPEHRYGSQECFVLTHACSDDARGSR
jgi:hypothetical protein